MCVCFATSSSKASTLLKHSWEQQGKLKSVFLISSSSFLLMCNVFSLSLSLSLYQSFMLPFAPSLPYSSASLWASLLVCGSPSRREKGEEDEEKGDEEERVGFPMILPVNSAQCSVSIKLLPNGPHLPSLLFLLRLN